MSAIVLALLALLLLAGAAIFGIWLLFGWFGSWRLNRRVLVYPDPSFTFTPWELGAEHEEWEFRTADGIAIRGWFLPRPGTSQTILSLHGYRGHMGQLLGISTNLWRAGFNVLLFDFRGRGRSEPAPISMGLWERRDLEAALDAVGRRIPDARIGLLGFSMGAAVAVLGGNDPRVRAIVLDSCFASQREILEEMAIREAARYLGARVDGRLFLPVMEWWHRRLGKPGFREIAPVDAIGGLDKPILVIQGTGDVTVPYAHAQRLAAEAAADLWLVSGAHHCGAYFVDREAYTKRVTTFFQRHLAEVAETGGMVAGRGSG
ncbi:MAG: alpha/beta hydrolase [Gemmatimonadota bacterium]